MNELQEAIQRRTREEAQEILRRKGWTVSTDKRKKGKAKNVSLTVGTPHDKSKVLEKDVLNFLKNGGEIQKIETGISGMEPSGNSRVGIVISGKEDATRSIITKKKES